MSDHDPMCGWEPDVPHADGSVTMTPCRCVLIARVRADEREVAALRVREVIALHVLSPDDAETVGFYRAIDAAVKGEQT